MKKSEFWLSFTIFRVLLFHICLSQGSTASPQDGDCVSKFYQHCGETAPPQSECDQHISPFMTSFGRIKLRKGNCPESLTWKTEVFKMMEVSGIENSLNKKTGNIENSTNDVKNRGKNFGGNVVATQAPFFSISRQEKIQTPKEITISPTWLVNEMMMSSRYSPTWNALVPEYASFSRSKREAAHKVFGKANTLFRLQTREKIFNNDQSLEALLREIIVNNIYGCDLIIVYDEIYRKTRTLETLVNIPFIKQVLQLVSLEDLSDMIQWESTNCQGIMLLLSEPNILLNFGGINRFLWAYKAKVIIVGLQLHSLEKFLKTVKGRKTEHVIGVVEDPINHIFEVYMNLLFWGEGMQLLTAWSGSKFTRKTNLFPDKINDLRNAELGVMIFEFRPLTFYEYAPDGTVIARYGRFLNVVRTLAEKFNFTINFIEIEKDWGIPLGNGSFTGLAGYLQRDDGQMGLPYIYHSGLDNRHKAQDYSRFIEDDKVCFFVRTEAPTAAWRSLGLPFTPQSWIAVISGLMLSGPIFYLLVMASTTTGEEYENFKSLAYSSLFTIGIQIDHPLVSMPKRICNQIFIVFLLIYGLILSTGYRSNLISFLTVARPPHQINTFKDLAESRLRVYGLEFYYNAFEVSGDPYLKELMKRYKITFTLEEFIDEFMEGKVSTINSRAQLEGVSTLMRTKTGKPLTRILEECLHSYTGTIGFQWHTPLKPRFNKAIARLVESGIPRQWALTLNEQYQKLVEREGGVTYYPDIWHDINDGLIPLSNSHMTGIWGIVAIGYFLGTVSFAVEVIIHKG